MSTEPAPDLCAALLASLRAARGEDLPPAPVPPPSQHYGAPITGAIADETAAFPITEDALRPGARSVLDEHVRRAADAFDRHMLDSGWTAVEPDEEDR